MDMKTIYNDAARLNNISAFKPLKTGLNKSLLINGVKLDKEVLEFILENKSVYNSFTSILKFIEELKPIKDSEVKISYDDDFYQLRYYIEIPRNTTFEDEMTILDKFFTFKVENFSEDVIKKNTLHTYYSHNIDNK